MVDHVEVLSWYVTRHLLKPTEPPALCRMGNEYQLRGSGSADGLCRPGITLTVPYRLYYRLSCPRMEDEYPAYTL